MPFIDFRPRWGIAERADAETVLHEVCLRLRRARSLRMRSFQCLLGRLCFASASVEQKCRMDWWCKSLFPFFTIAILGSIKEAHSEKNLCGRPRKPNQSSCSCNWEENKSNSAVGKWNINNAINYSREKPSGASRKRGTGFYGHVGQSFQELFRFNMI